MDYLELIGLTRETRLTRQIRNPWTVYNIVQYTVKGIKRKKKAKKKTKDISLFTMDCIQY